MDVQVSFGLAFLAGLVSFLSPCVLPVVPSYVTFVSGMTLEELRDGGTAGARRAAAIHALMFVTGFMVVFMTMGLAATAFGQSLARALPLLSRLGGVLVAVFGLYLLGVLRIPALSRDVRFRFSHHPGGPLGSMAVGVAFGAGWTPCIGPILGTVLLYATFEGTGLHGMALLAAYGLGLAIPFLAAALAFNWFLAGIPRARAWVRPLERVAGTLLVVVGVLMMTGHFATLSAFLAGMGQLINLES